MNYESLMQRALELAAQGGRAVMPNPMVGAVIVCDGKVVGEGYHVQYGGLHAEANAVAAVLDRAMLSRSTLVVSLEPCNHTGKTPPCTDLIIENDIPRIVVGMRDPNSLVAGRGIERLRAAGREVVEGMLESACRALNKRFVTAHTKKRPYVILKWAQTADGFIARSDYSSKWISSEESRNLVHRMRAEEMAVMVATTTALVDNPQLTVRNAQGKNPIRIVLDRTLRVPRTHHVYNGEAETIIYHEADVTEAAPSPNVTLVKIPFGIAEPLQGILEDLHRRSIISVIVEGGAQLLQSFLERDLWDEAFVFTSQQTFGSGIAAPGIPTRVSEERKIGTDRLSIYARC